MPFGPAPFYSTMNRLFLASICFLCFAPGNSALAVDPKPLEELSPEEQENYAKLLQEYHATDAKRDGFLKQKMDADPAFARAAYWLENERLKKSTKYRQLEKNFKTTLNAEQTEKYNQWLRGYLLSVGRETMEKEWSSVPSARPALLSVAEMYVTARSAQLPEGKVAPDTGQSEAPELKGNESERWQQFLAWSKRSNEDVIKRSFAVEQELSIPKELNEELRKETVDGALFGVYDMYYRAQSEPELTNFRREIVASVNKLSTLRPGWEVAEDLERPERDPR